ncbi:MAG: hypothetical protein HY791_08620 [Deltaproteobacteria bacterium]|nr:hypothetical protein [Deltaproteobacteria bacterium]
MLRAFLGLSLLCVAGPALGQTEADEEDLLENPPPPVDTSSTPVAGAVANASRTATAAIAVEGSETPKTRSSTQARKLSWNVVGGPRGRRAAVTLELGFARVPRATLEVPVMEGLIVGARGGFAFADRTPGRGFKPALEVVALVRWAPPIDVPFDLGVVIEPGAKLGGEKAGQHFLLGLSAEATTQVGDGAFVGGSFSVPVAIATGGAALTSVSVEAGPLFEVHLNPSLALTLDVRAGVAVDRSEARFSMSMLAGGALRL